MPNNTIELVIKATDAASGPIKGVVEQLGVLDKGMEAIKELAATIFIGFSADKLIDSITDAQTATNNLNRQYATFGSTVSVTKGEMEDFAESTAKNTTLTSESLKNAQAVLLNYSATTGSAFKQSRDLVVDLAAAMGGDAAQAAQTLGRALENPIQGTRLLAELGVTLSARQRETIALLVQEGSAASAQAFIYGQLQERLHGVANEMSGTLGGSLTNLKNSFTSAFTGAGAGVDELTKSIKDLAAEVQSPEVQSGIQQIVKMLVSAAGSAVAGVAAVGNYLKRQDDRDDNTSAGSDGDTTVATLKAKISQLTDLLNDGRLPGEQSSDFADRVTSYNAQLDLLQKKLDQVTGVAKDTNETLDEITVTAARPGLEEPIREIIPRGQKVDPDNLINRNTQLPASLVTAFQADTEDDLDKAFDTLQQKIAERWELLRAGKLDVFQVVAGNLQDQNAYDKLVDDAFAPIQTSAKKFYAPLDDIEKEGKEVSQTLTTSFESFFTSGDLSIRNFAKTFITALEQILAKAVATDLVEALGINKLFSASSAAGNSSATGGLFGAIGAIFTGHAGGGQIFGPSIVGENGPELFVPGSSGTIRNARQMAFSGGGGGNGLNYAPIHNITVVADDSKKTQAALLQYLTSQQKQDMADFKRQLARNGYNLK